MSNCHPFRCRNLPLSCQVATLLFSYLVNGRVGGCLSLLWLVLRRLYSIIYRASSGKPLGSSPPPPKKKEKQKTKLVLPRAAQLLAVRFRSLGFSC